MSHFRALLIASMLFGAGIGLHGLHADEPCDGWTNAAKVCVSASILESTFKDYKPENPPPSEAALSQIRQLAWNYDDMTAKWHACEANLSNATLKDRQAAVKSADEAMIQRLNDVAPVGKNGKKQIWSLQEGRYTEAPEATPAPKDGK